jgi:hypothetical protein
MSTAVSTRQLTPTQRISEATRRVSEQLGLADHKLVTAALVEAAAEGVQRNGPFATHVRTLYEKMAARPQPRRASPKSSIVPWDVELTPVKYIEGYVANPALPPDPYLLYEAYGTAQLPTALGRYKLSDLLLAAETVQQRHPGTKPKNKRNRDDVIDYIVRYVTGRG